MSHFTSVTVNITDADCVEEALKGLNFKYTRNGSKFQITPTEENRASTYHGITIEVKADGKTSIGADWYYLKNEWSQANFTQKVTQAYGAAKVRREMTARGYRAMQQSVDAQGGIVAVYRKFT